VLVELNKMEQRYEAVVAVIRDGFTVSEVAAAFGVSRQSVHAWMARYERGGLPALAERSHRPHTSPLQMPARIEARVLEMRRLHPNWGHIRIRHQLDLAGLAPLPSVSGIYRALVRHHLIEPQQTRKRLATYKRWERGTPMELWQMDVVGGVLLADGTECKVLTGIDDHSRFCVCAVVMTRATGRAVCGFFAQALERHGVPEEILTDNGKVFTNRFGVKPTEVLFDKICRDNGIVHRLTAPASPTTTGKIERFHRTLREEFLRGQMFVSLVCAQEAFDVFVDSYNKERPHRSLGMLTPSERFYARPESPTPDLAPDLRVLDNDRSGDDWVSRVVSVNGVVTVSSQAFSVGRHRAGEVVDVHVTGDMLQVWCGNELLKSVLRQSTGEVRKKKAERQPKRRIGMSKINRN
jgi:transposase InsO family protein